MRDKRAFFQTNDIPQEIKKLYTESSKKEILCVYRILSCENRIPSCRIVEMALSQQFTEDCLGCASADNIFRALKKLQEEGFIVGHLRKGGYIWELIV